MEKNMKIPLLYGFYKEMLTEKQADCIEYYYDEDLSLGEISQNLGITRQGVRDNIKRGEKALLNIENRLKLADKFMKIKDKVAKIDEIIDEIQNDSNVNLLPNGIKVKINEILTVILEINENV